MGNYIYRNPGMLFYLLRQRFTRSTPINGGVKPVIFITLKDYTMLRWTVTFLVIAIIAAIFGFGGIAAGAASIAKILFYIFLILFVISLISGGFRKVD
jgi:uncharacterized membrane protein YtjA (UPF0391 family)